MRFGRVHLALQIALTALVLTALVLTASALASEDREGAGAGSESGAAGADAREEPARHSVPALLPPKLAPRSLPRPDASVPSPAAAGRAPSSPVAAPRKKVKPGAPVEIGTRKDDFKARLGSQSARGGGVVGRYDGLMASQALGESARLNLASGFPLVPSNTAGFDPGRSFYALSLDLAPFEAGLSGRIFGVQQHMGAKQDHHAIGGELGFDHAHGFGLLTLDYDVDFRDLGAVSLLAGTKLGARTTVNALLDARRYTGPSAYATLQTQPVASVQQLLDRLSQGEIRAPTFASEAQTRTVALGASRQLTDRLQLAGDVTLKNVLPDSTPSRVAAPPVGQIDYVVRATWKDLWLARSSTTAALRIAELADSRRYSGSVGGQYPILQSLRVGPDLSFELAEGKERWSYRPSMRFEYLQTRLRLEFQLGLEIRDVGLRNPADRTGMFYKVGYRYDF